jgi:hypothetical protein
MNLLTQLTLGEMLEFLNTLNEDTVLNPCWGAPAPSQEEDSRVSLLQGTRGNVRGLKSVINRILNGEIEGRQYNPETLVDVYHCDLYHSMTLGILIAAIRSWKGIGE